MEKIPIQLKKWIDSNARYYLNTVPAFVSGSQLSVRGPEQGWDGHVKTVFVFGHICLHALRGK